MPRHKNPIPTPVRVFDGTAAGFGRRQQRFQQLPLPVVQVGGVIWSVHTPRLRHSARSSPSCLYASFYLFRHPLIETIRYKGLELNFRRTVQDTAERAEALVAVDESTVESSLPGTLDPDPRITILKSWASVETAIEDLASAHRDDLNQSRGETCIYVGWNQGCIAAGSGAD